MAHDFESRFQTFRHAVEALSLDGFLISKPHNLHYVHNFRGSSGLAIHSSCGCDLIVDSRYLESAELSVRKAVVRLAPRSLEETLVASLSQQPRQRIGFEANHLSYAAASRLESRLPQHSWIPTCDLIETHRAVKQTSEIDLIREALRRSQEAFSRTVASIRVGDTEQEIAGRLEYEMRRLGSEGTAFETIVASGPRSSLPHGTASDRKLAEGEPLLVDFGLRWHGYHSDLTRVLLPGSPELQSLASVVREAREAAFASVRPGVLSSEVDAAARQVIASHGFGDYFGHGTGHGIGLEIHEFPRISPRDPVPLQEHMVMTIEPGIYIPGRYGVRLEDVLVVTHNGCRLLSDADR